MHAGCHRWTSFCRSFWLVLVARSCLMPSTSIPSTRTGQIILINYTSYALKEVILLGSTSMVIRVLHLWNLLGQWRQCCSMYVSGYHNNREATAWLFINGHWWVWFCRVTYWSHLLWWRQLAHALALAGVIYVTLLSLLNCSQSTLYLIAFSINIISLLLCSGSICYWLPSLQAQKLTEIIEHHVFVQMLSLTQLHTTIHNTYHCNDML